MCALQEVVYPPRCEDNRSGFVDISELPFEFWEHMKSEQNRLETFVDWPRETRSQRPENLAEAGWFYTHTLDRVQCPFCYGVLKNWLPSDNPFTEHTRHFPQCRFIRGYYVGNIPISNNVSSMFSSNYARSNTPPGVSTLYPRETPNVPMITQLRPTSNHYGFQGNSREDLKNEENRLQTFSRWPMYINQTPEDLSRAGFYHYPSDDKPDRVKCAYCEGKLFNWQPQDDPWVEHAKYYPHCEYIILCLGEDVVRDLQLKVIRTPVIPRPPSRPATPPTPDPSVYRHSIPEYFPEPYVAGPEVPAPNSAPVPAAAALPERREASPSQDLHRRMQSEPVQAVIEMGFPQKLVKDAVEQCIRERADDFPHAEELASMVMAMEEDAARPAPTSSATSLTPLQRLIASRSRSVQPTAEAVSSAPSRSPAGAISSFSPAASVPVLDRTPNRGGDVIVNPEQNPSLTSPQGVIPKHLLEENSRLKDLLLCKICMEEKVKITFMPCGHLVCCGECSMAVSECPICRSPISRRVKTIF